MKAIRKATTIGFVCNRQFYKQRLTPMGRPWEWAMAHGHGMMYFFGMSHFHCHLSFKKSAGEMIRRIQSDVAPFVTQSN